MSSCRFDIRGCGLLFAALILLAVASPRAQAIVTPPPAQAPGDSVATPPPAQTAGDSLATPVAPAPAVAAPAAPAVAVPAAGGTITATPEELPPPAEGDGGWPRSMTTVSGSTIILYQPQLLSWERQREVVAMAAISYLGKGDSKPTLGTLKLSSPTSVSMEDRLVSLTRVQVSEINFSSLSKEKSQEVLAELMKSLPEAPVVVSLDRVLAMMDKSQIRADGIQIKTDPPTIHMSTKPAILVQFDGEPILAPISGTTLKYVVNTNWDVLIDDATKTYYLRNEDSWYQATDLKGKWEKAKLPKAFANIPDDDNWREVKENIPGKGKKPPVIFVTTTPAELLLLDGNPKYVEIEKKGDLLWVTNTDSDLFRMKKADFYYLVAGRWFRAPDLEGPWKFATADLPAEFLRIPPDHERARVRSSIPGTDEAAEAVLMAQVPQTARVNAKEIKAADVKYDGLPDFKAIEGSPVAYAANCSHDVLKLRDAYYLCDRGIWFTSASPTGPWVVATSVPQEIYSIPSSSPVHHVTYVTVVDSDPAYPTYAYTAGYTGVSIAFGCAMWGTGWYYPPYYHYPPGGGYPVYYPRPVTYGGGAMYNPYNGSYGHYQAAYGPYGGVARGATYNPSTGTYKRGAVAYGPGGAQGYGQAYNPRTGTYATTRQGSNAYGSWGSSSVQRGDDWARTQRVTDANGNTKWAAQGSGGGSAAGWQGPGNSGGFVGQSGSGDVYAGRNGNVYKKTDGGWQTYENGGWNDVSGGGSGNRPSQQPAGGSGAANRPSTQPSTRPGGPQASTQPAGGAGVSSMDQLNRDAQARNQGAQRSRDYSNQRSSSTSSNRGGSYGGSRSSGASRGGASRGGGGGRRR